MNNTTQISTITTTSSLNNTTTKFISIPYVRGLFENIKHLLKKYNISTAGNAHNALSKSIFSKIKDSTTKEMQSNLIYKVNCECNSIYIGMTKQYLKSRIQQHISDSKNTTNITKKKSALSDHLISTNHTISFDDVTIVNRELKYRKRNIMEMLYIKKYTNTLNKQTDSEYIQNIYNNII